jgi:hypothetical protein
MMPLLLPKGILNIQDCRLLGHNNYDNTASIPVNICFSIYTCIFRSFYALSSSKDMCTMYVPNIFNMAAKMSDIALNYLLIY